jgi:hypothetical protein
MTCVVLAGAWSAGCGSLDRAKLHDRVETIGSVAAEGRLLADDVRRDRARATFVRVHARELADEADGQAERLADASAPAALAPARARALALAMDVSDSIGELQIRPGDERTGRRVADRLRSYAAAARRLEAGL